MNTAERIKDLLETLQSDTATDLKHLEMLENDNMFDSQFLYSRNDSILKEIKATIQSALNILEELEEEETQNKTIHKYLIKE